MILFFLLKRKNFINQIYQATNTQIATILNNAIGGSKTSAHSHVYAADLVPSNGKVEEFKEFTMHWLHDNNIKFDQYINEYKGNSSWVHIGIRNGSGQQRQQYKLFYGGKYTKIDPNTFKGISTLTFFKLFLHAFLIGK